MKPRTKVYELARELDRTSREVLRAAADLGILAQNRLTKLDPESASRIRNHFRGQESEDRPGSDHSASRSSGMSGIP